MKVIVCDICFNIANNPFAEISVIEFRFKNSEGKRKKRKRLHMCSYCNNKFIELAKKSENRYNSYVNLLEDQNNDGE
jgi:hypothetical protein